MKFEEMEKALRERRDLKALIDSPEGKALAAGLDEAALKKAAAAHDTAALGDILRRVLSTPEGRALAEKVEKAAGEK